MLTAFFNISRSRVTSRNSFFKALSSFSSLETSLFLEKSPNFFEFHVRPGVRSGSLGMGRGGAEGGLAIPPDPGLKPEHLLTGAPKFIFWGLRVFYI